MGREIAIKRGHAFTKKLRCSCGRVTIVPRNLTGKVKCRGCSTVSKARDIAEREGKKK